MGDEADFVIVDTVRTTEPGHVVQSKIINTMDTRARYGTLWVMNEKLSGRSDLIR